MELPIYGLTLALNAALLAALHWQPVGRGTLHPTANYAQGMAVVLASYTLARLLIGPGPWWLVWLYAAVGGATVLAAYAVDAHIAARRAKDKAARLEREAIRER